MPFLKRFSIDGKGKVILSSYGDLRESSKHLFEFLSLTDVDFEPHLLGNLSHLEELVLDNVGWSDNRIYHGIWPSIKRATLRNLSDLTLLQKMPYLEELYLDERMLNMYHLNPVRVDTLKVELAIEP